MTAPVFVLPHSLLDAETRLNVTTFERRAIERQLTDRKDETPSEELRAWRKKALWALEYKIAEARFLSTWMKMRNVELNRQMTRAYAETLGLDPDNPTALLTLAHSVMRRALATPGFEYTDRDQSLADAIRQYLTDDMERQWAREAAGQNKPKTAEVLGVEP